MTQRQQFDLVYAGAILSGYTEEQVTANFVTHLKIPTAKAEKLFSGKRVVLKKSLSKEKAEIWQKKLLKIGAEAALVPSVNTKEEIVTPKATTAESEVASEPSVSKSPASQEEYDLEMEQRINRAKAMIATQQLEQKINNTKDSSPLRRLWIFSVVLAVIVLVLYFYMESVV